LGCGAIVTVDGDGGEEVSGQSVFDAIVKIECVVAHCVVVQVIVRFCFDASVGVDIQKFFFEEV
jgi:hypothetical protein